MLRNDSLFLDFCDTIAFLYPTDFTLFRRWLIINSFSFEDSRVENAIQFAKDEMNFFSSVLMSSYDDRKKYYLRYNSLFLQHLSLPDDYAGSLYSLFTETNRHWKVSEKYKSILFKLSSVFQSVYLVSNFDSSLKDIVSRNNCQDCFKEIYASASIGLEKPNKEFYSYILNENKLNSKHVIMIGDSYELDIIPATSLGMKAIHLSQANLSNTQSTHSTLASFESILKFFCIESELGN